MFLMGVVVYDVWLLGRDSVLWNMSARWRHTFAPVRGGRGSAHPRRRRGGAC